VREVCEGAALVHSHGVAALLTHAGAPLVPPVLLCMPS
jgi:hypothetical protein